MSTHPHTSHPFLRTSALLLIAAGCSETAPDLTGGRPNEAPTASIEAPDPGASFSEGESIGFRGTGTDPEDGSLSGSSLVWTSDLDGEIGTGNDVTHSGLSVGSHTITLTAVDTDGETASESVSIAVVNPPPSQNSPPTAAISSPADGSSFAAGAVISFQGSGTDAEEGALTGGSLVWTSSADGQIGTGESFASSSLSAGTHDITLTATDAQGATGSASASITITTSSNTAPSASIQAPGTGEIFTSGNTISFQGSGSDAEDGSLSGASLVWSSDLDGPIGTGGSVSAAGLSMGRHTVTLTATDSQGATGSASVVVNVALVGVPLQDMTATDSYKGFSGRLYPNGNGPPSAHRAEGVGRAGAISGTAVLMSLGMSNTEQHFADFLARAQADATLSPNLVIVNGAQAGKEANDWESPSAGAYNTARSRLASAGVGESDVDALWILLANAGPTVAMPASNSDARELVARIGNVLRAARSRYPNLRQVFFSSRIYSCARIGLNPEPYAYESGFAIKWLIEAQIDQIRTGQIDPLAGDLDYRDGTAPWIAWSRYLWADNGNPRKDGLTWQRSDLQTDCTHPSASGTAKVGTRLLSFFKGSAFTRPWFVR